MHCCVTDKCNAKLFDSETSLLNFIRSTLNPSIRANKQLTDARTLAYGFISNYVKSCGRLVLDNALAIKDGALIAYISEEVSSARLAALALVREVLMLKAFSAKQLQVKQMFNQLFKDIRVGKMRQTLMVGCGVGHGGGGGGGRELLLACISALVCACGVRVWCARGPRS